MRVLAKSRRFRRAIDAIARSVVFTTFGLLALSAPLRGQDETFGATWRDAESADAATDAATDAQDSGEFVGPATTRYSLELSKLPDGAGQFWVVYDVSPYASRFPNMSRPQDSIVDWILFDSGDDFWRKEPFAVLSATRERLYAYHNADVQRYVSNVVDRFIAPDKTGESFSIKIVALQSPDWRARVSQYLTPLATTIVGNGVDAQGWLVDKGNLSKVTSELSRRSDYALLNGVKNSVPNAETFGWAAAAPRKNYARDYRLDASSPSGYSADEASVDEGFRIETTPLLSTTGEVLEVMFRYRATVVERAKTFSLRVPTPTSPRQQLSVEKPMIVSCDFRGKTSFERTKCAIVDLGLVPLILPKKDGESSGFVESVSNLVAPKSVYYDVLLIIGDAE